MHFRPFWFDNSDLIPVDKIARIFKLSWNYDSRNVSMPQTYICFIGKFLLFNWKQEMKRTKYEFFPVHRTVYYNITRLSHSFLRLWCIVKIPSHKPLLWTFQICFYFPSVNEVHFNAQINHLLIQIRYWYIPCVRLILSEPFRFLYWCYIYDAPMILF